MLKYIKHESVSSNRSIKSRKPNLHNNFDDVTKERRRKRTLKQKHRINKNLFLFSVACKTKEFYLKDFACLLLNKINRLDIKVYILFTAYTRKRKWERNNNQIYMKKQILMCSNMNQRCWKTAQKFFKSNKFKCLFFCYYHHLNSDIKFFYQNQRIQENKMNENIV